MPMEKITNLYLENPTFRHSFNYFYLLDSDLQDDRNAERRTKAEYDINIPAGKSPTIINLLHVNAFSSI